jgi:hypothetical protein
MAEAAIVITAFLIIIAGVIDLGMALFYREMLSEAARHGARQAIVHGSKAPAAMGVWGPTTYSGAASDSHDIADAIRTHLAVLNPSSVNITVEWIDGGNEEEQRVRVTLDYTYQPMTTLVFQSTFPLRASSTMPIAH